MDEILLSIENGQRKQAITQLNDSSYSLDDLFEALLIAGQCDEIIKMYRVAVNVKYIKFN